MLSFCTITFLFILSYRFFDLSFRFPLFLSVPVSLLFLFVLLWFISFCRLTRPPSSFPYFGQTFSSSRSCPCTGVRVRAHACDREGTSWYNTKGRKIGNERERTLRATRLEIISMLRVEDRTCSRTCQARFRVFDRIFYVCTPYTVHPAAINSYSVAYRRHPIYGDFVGRVIRPVFSIALVN